MTAARRMCVVATGMMLAAMMLVSMMLVSSAAAEAGPPAPIDFQYDNPGTSSQEDASAGAELDASGPSSTTRYGVADVGPTAASSSAAVNPANCTTTADNPHASSHVPGTINAVVRQSCPAAVENNSTEALLWEHRWWGYDIIGGPAFSDLTTSRTSSINVSAP